jgi:hypothetical protein
MNLGGGACLLDSSKWVCCAQAEMGLMICKLKLSHVEAAPERKLMKKV